LQENLARGLGIVGRAVATRSTLPILSNILLTTDGGRLRLSATNLELGIVCWIGAKVDEEGSACVPARLLGDFVNSLPPERIDMNLVIRTQTLNLKCARYEANIKGLEPQDFPLIPTREPDDQIIALDSALFREMIDQVAFAAATEESRPILTGVLTVLSPHGLTMVAADGYRLSVRTAETALPIATTESVIVPARTLIELGRIAAQRLPAAAECNQPIELSITKNRNQVLFRLPDVDVVSQLIEGAFPDYNQIVPKGYTTRTVVSTGELLKAVRVALLFARDAANIVRLQITPGAATGGSPGQLTLTATSAEIGDNVTQLDAAVDGEAIEISFNAKYLIDLLSVLGAPQVSIETTISSSPGVLKPVGVEGFTHVIMPMHLPK
jgi:DNA polymerase-3 subunit beta